MFKCPVCGEHEFDYYGDLEICPVCMWQNDSVDHYANIDDDEESPLGAAIFREVTGMEVWDVVDMLDEDDT